MPIRSARHAMLAALVMTIPALLLPGPPAGADRAAFEGGFTPARVGSAAAWTGTHAYIFGGWGEAGYGALDEIVRYDPSTDALTPSAQRLPSPRYHATAAFNGQYAYVFGGNTPEGTVADIVRYDPALDRVERLNVTLPEPVLGAPAVWDGTHVYLFGGDFAGTGSSRIVRFDPAAATAEYAAAELPSPRAYASAVWDGQYAYIFGGKADPPTNEIVRFDPATGNVTVIPEQLPFESWGASAVWGGDKAYVFERNATLVYEPSMGTITSLRPMLPSRLGWTSAATDGERAFVFGGRATWHKDPTTDLDGVYSEKALLIDLPAPDMAGGSPDDLLAVRVCCGGAVWTGEQAYLVGGEDGTCPNWCHTRLIQRYDPSTNAVTVMGATLPSARRSGAVGWDGKHVYHFGGCTNATGFSGESFPCAGPANLLAEIVRYDPGADKTVLMAKQLPAPRGDMSVVWTGAYFFLFGGSNGTSELDTILRVDPASGKVTTMAARLPSPMRSTSAAWDGTHAYIFGGNSSGAPLDAILRYDPAADSLATMGGRLPTPRDGTAATWNGTHAHVYGGYDGKALNQVVAYHPGSDEVNVTTARLPTPRSSAAAVWAGDRALVFGGLWDVEWRPNHSPGRGGGPELRDIVEVRPGSGAATTLSQPELPVGVEHAAHATDDRYLFVFGGRHRDQYNFAITPWILRYDSVTGQVRAMDAQLPEKLLNAAAARVGAYYYIFGGFVEFQGSTNQILRYDPSADVLERLDVNLTTNRTQMSAESDGSAAYLFGGTVCEVSCIPDAQILKFDPSLNLVTLAGALTEPVCCSAAAYDGSDVYVFGGLGFGSDISDRITRFDPTTGAATPMQATIQAAWSSAAVWSGSHAYVFGGFITSTSASDDIRRYNVSADVLETMDAPLTPRRVAPVVAWLGGAAIVLGGSDSGSERLMRYTLEPGAPRDLAASLQAGEVHLSWDPPSPTSFSAPIAHYRVYRDGALLVELGNVTNHTDPSAPPPEASRVYRVSAVNGAGEGPQGSGVRVEG